MRGQALSLASPTINLRATLAAGTLLAAWLVAVVLWITSRASISHPWLWLALIGALVGSNYLWLPLGHGARLWFSSVPCFLIAVALPPAQTMVLMGIAMSLKEIAICRRCHNDAFHIAGQAGRWMVLAGLGSALAQVGGAIEVGVLVGFVLWAGDVVTAPLVVWFGSVRKTITILARRTWMDELMQYLGAYFLAVCVLLGGSVGRLLLLPLIVLLICYLGLYVPLRREGIRTDVGDG